jgi:hypothetical protein
VAGGALARRYDRAIERGLEASRTLVLCLSPAALESDCVVLERSTVGRGNLRFRDPVNACRRFIPLQPADCRLRDTLRRNKKEDYTRCAPCWRRVFCRGRSSSGKAE